MLEMMVMLDFSIKGYVISEKQFQLEKKQEVMPFCLNRWGLFSQYFIKFTHLLMKRIFLTVVFFFILNMILLSYFKFKV